METAAIGTRVSSPKGITDWENYPWHRFLGSGIRTHRGIQAELEIPTGPGSERRLPTHKEEGGWLNTLL